MYNKVYLELNRIEIILNREYKKQEDVSLMNGIGSIPLFYESLFKLTKEKKYEIETQKALDYIFDKLNNNWNNGSFNFYAGLSGVAYSLHLLTQTETKRKKHLLKTLLVLDDIISEYTLNNITTRNDIDFLPWFSWSKLLFKRKSKNKY